MFNQARNGTGRAALPLTNGRRWYLSLWVALVALVIAGCAQTVPVAAPTPTHQSGVGVDKARPFSAASPWNARTPSGTAWFNTPMLHHLAAPLSNGDSFRHWWVNTDAVGIWWSSPTDPVWTFDLPDYVAPAWHRNRPARVIKMRAPANLAAGTDSDHILVVVDPATGHYVEVWEASVDPVHRRVTNIAGMPGWATGNAITGPGAGTIANNDGVRAANFSWAAGLITGADLASGKIDHALVVSLTSEILKGGFMTGTGAWRVPATAWDAGPWGGRVQMGSRIGIPAGAAKPAGLSPLGSMMFDALKKYGAFVGDFAGGPWPMFYADSRSIPSASSTLCPLYCFWEHNGSADMEKIGPLLRVADYQP